MSDACETPMQNASDDEIRHILSTARTIAIVGLSANPDRDSYRVAAYLQQHGYTIIPVNPSATEILGVKSHPSLREVSGSVDIVDIFRKPEAVPEIVDEAIAIGARVIWMQLGIAHNVAADKARAAGLQVVMSRCIMVDHRNLGYHPLGEQVRPNSVNASKL
jgi:predicted CoA-binding protein